MIFFLFFLILLITFFWVCIDPLFLKKKKKFVFHLEKPFSQLESIEVRMVELQKDLLEKKISEQDFQEMSKKLKHKE